MKRALQLISLAAALAMAAPAQCVMCYRTAAAQNQARARVLNAGILVLGMPPLLLLTGFVVVLWRRSAGESEED